MTVRRLALLLALAAPLGAPRAQTTVETGQGVYQALPAGARSDVFVLDADAGTVFAGPQLVIIPDDGAPRFAADDPAFDPRTAIDPRAFAIDAETRDGQQAVWVGLGFADTVIDAEEPPATAAGFAISTDGGASWQYRPPPLDETRDTTVFVGDNALLAIPFTVPQDAAPLDVAIAPGDTVYSANRSAGLRRTTDGGRTWRRIVLPPDSLSVLDPREPQSFIYAPQGAIIPGGTVESPNRSTEALNFFAISLTIGEDSTVWVGTASGLNRSVRLPGVEDLAWIRYLDSPFGNAPIGNAILALETRPVEGAPDEIWVACQPSVDDRFNEDEESGITVWTGDDAEGRAQFDTRLLGVRVFDLAFDGGRAYAASDEGLYVADDASQDVWRVVRVFQGPDGAPLPIPEDTGVFAVAATPGTVWAGTPEGLLRSDDAGASWTLLRTNLAPGVPFRDGDDTPDVDVYAYPNPFTPRTDGFARVRFDLPAAADVTVRVFDFGMRPVRTLEAPGRPAGPNEVLWDGQTDGGTRVANGAYIYVVDAGGDQRSGKLLVFE